MNRSIVTVVVVIILGMVVLWVFAGRNNDENVNIDTDEDSEDRERDNFDSGNADDESDDSDDAESVSTGEAKSFTVSSSNFTFSTNEIRVKQGERVTITLVNEDGTHDWKVDEFNAATKIMTGPASDSVTFVADKKGTYEYYCSVGSHRQMGMRGNLIVE